MALVDFKDGVSFTALSATTAGFTVQGGRYAFMVNATWGGGSVTLQVLMPDASTYIAAGPAYGADSTDIFNLPRGTYRIAIVTATAVQGALVPVPYPQAA